MTSLVSAVVEKKRKIGNFAAGAAPQKIAGIRHYGNALQVREPGGCRITALID